MIQFKDFVPKQTVLMQKERTGLIPKFTYESLDACIAAMNVWAREEGVNILNIETVVLPNMHSPVEEGSQDVALRDFQGAVWYQFIRVWYSLT
jgi:hypothetical protein